MKGKLIVIDGLDGSGKATQSEILYKKLKENGENVIKVSFPNYSGKGSTLVKMYLQGELSNNAEEVNAYASSTFFAADRYTSFMQDWKKEYENGAYVILDRYTTSNAVHQTSKLPKEEWDEFLDWLFDYEYNKLCIPKPSLVIYLDMKPEVSQKLLSKRYKGDESKKDIHEKDVNYIKSCRDAALYVANKYNWKIISCDENGEPLTIEEISKKIDSFFKS